jgi:hypothetical protein
MARNLLHACAATRASPGIHNVKAQRVGFECTLKCPSKQFLEISAEGFVETSIFNNTSIVIKMVSFPQLSSTNHRM